MKNPHDTIANIAGSIKEPFEKSAKIVSIEIVDDLVRVSLSWTQGNKIHILRSCEAHYKKEELKQTIKNILSKITLSTGNYRYLVLADHNYVTTERSATSLMRRDKNAKITQAELENIVAKALWKIFNNQRRRSAKKMNSADIDMYPAGAEFLQIKLDKNQVMNPLEFIAKSVEYWGAQTITTKKLVNLLFSVLPEEDVIQIEEVAATLVKDILKNQSKKEGFLLAIIGLNETAFYKARDSAFSYIDKISWGSSQILTALEKNLGLSKDQAREILDIYQNYQASPAVLKKLGIIIGGELAVLLKGVEAHKKRISVDKVYVHSFFSISELLQDKKIKKRIDILTPITVVDNLFIGENIDFELKLSKQINSRYNFISLFSCLAKVNEEQKNPLLDKITKQRFRLLKDT